MIVKRYKVVAILLILGPMLGSCSGFAGTVADNWPHWAGGMPADVPPRPGAPGYDEFIAHGQATVQDPTNSITSGPSGASDTTTAGGVPVKFQQIPAQGATQEAAQNNEPAPKRPVAHAAKKPIQNTQTATKEPAQNNKPAPKKQVARAAKKPVQNTQAATAPAATTSDNQSSPGPSVGSGGLY
jgi:hypothetical protein